MKIAGACTATALLSLMGVKYYMKDKSIRQNDFEDELDANSSDTAESERIVDELFEKNF